MTREQAINYLISSGFSEEQVSEVVRALTYEPTTKNDLGVDAVSRQAVLDKKELIELEDGQSFYCISTEDVETLPSVTPQEPFKPMVEIDLYSVIKQKYFEREALDKIRAEIEARLCDVVSDYTDGYRTAIQGDLAILDKYKAESEEV